MNQRKVLEHLCCYITRPAIANDHLTLNSEEKAVLTLNHVTVGIHVTSICSDFQTKTQLHSLPWRIGTKKEKHKANHQILITMRYVPLLLCASVLRVCFKASV